MKALFLALLLSGCAVGVQMTPDEQIECRASGCTAWTLDELRALVKKAHDTGYFEGVHSL